LIVFLRGDDGRLMMAWFCRFIISLLLFGCFFLTRAAVSQEYYVSTENGMDINSGTFAKPFRTISQAVKRLKPGDTCFVMKGHYHEVVSINLQATKAMPITISAYNSERVVIDGTEPLNSKNNRKFYMNGRNYLVVKVHDLFEQVFRDDQMLVEARWPNMKFPDDLWSPGAWAKTKAGSKYGYIEDSDIPTEFYEHKLRAKLNVGHRFFTWSRSVSLSESHMGGFTYPKDLLGLGNYVVADKPWKKRAWANGQYYFYDSLVLLDREDEWFLDREMLDLYLLGGSSLSNLYFKKRAYGLLIKDSSNINIQGIDFFATSFQVLNCDHCSIENSNLQYPVYVRELASSHGDAAKKIQTLVSGTNNRLSHVNIAYSNTGGLEIRGYGNVLENSDIHDVSWDGSLINPAVKVDAIRPLMMGGKNIIKHNNIYNTGSVIVDIENTPYNIIAFNHIYRGGLASNDVSLIYTQNPSTVGTEIHHNWVHDSPSNDGGLCVRGDDQSRGLHIHHNIIWNCKWYGLVLKGDNHYIYNNTFFNNGKADILLRVGSEKEKPWRRQWPLLRRQNEGSQLLNNHFRSLRKDNDHIVLKLKQYSNNSVAIRIPNGFDIKHLSFQPAYNDGYCDKGIELSGVGHEFSGLSPDIGVFECGESRWKAGPLIDVKR